MSRGRFCRHLQAAGLALAFAPPTVFAQEYGANPVGSSPAPSPANRPPAWPAVLHFEPGVRDSDQGRNVTLHFGQKLKFDLDATDPDGDPITYTAIAVPAGAQFNAEHGTFAWQTAPRDQGVHRLRFAASDGSKTAKLEIEVHVAPDEAPDVSEGERMSWQFFEGQAAQFTVAEDRDFDELRVSTSGLPSGARMRVEHNHVYFEWTPSARDVGTHRIAFVVSDGERTATVEKTIVVHAEWDHNIRRTYFAPSVGYAAFAPLDAPRAFHGPSLEVTFYAAQRGGPEGYRCGRDTEEDCTPSHYRFYFGFEVLFPLARSDTPDPTDREPIFAYGFGFTRSFEYYPGRRWLIPHYGAELGGLTQKSTSHHAQLTPFLGVHLWTDRHVWLDLTGGARIVPADLEARSGPSARLSLMVNAW